MGVAGKNCIGANCHTSHKYVYFKEASITNSNGGGGIVGKNCIGENCHTSHKYVYFKEASITNSNGE